MSNPASRTSVVASRVRWQPSAIQHRDLRRVSIVLSELEEGYAFGNVTSDLQKRIQDLDLPAGVSVDFGGKLESSGDANKAIFSAMPVGVLLLLIFLLLEFNSFRRLAMVLVTVPLATVGVVPGLLLSDNPFGFTALLGVIALVGIVVNNAIVLVDEIQLQRREGSPAFKAIVDSGVSRLRPVAMAALTTALGMIPLLVDAFFVAMAVTIIAGLMAATVLTMVVLPVLYAVLFRVKYDESQLAG